MFFVVLNKETFGPQHNVSTTFASLAMHQSSGLETSCLTNLHTYGHAHTASETRTFYDHIIVSTNSKPTDFQYKDCIKSAFCPQKVV